MKNRLCLFVALLCAAGTLSAGIRFYRAHLHPDLKGAKVTIRKAVLLPPLIEFSKVTMKGAEGMSAESEKLAEALYAVFARELAARGVEVYPKPSADALTPEAKYAVANLQSKYDSLRVQLRKKPRRVDEGQASLGDGIAAFEPARGADVIVMVRGIATKATTGKKVAIVIGHGAVSNFQGDVGFVDARSGAVLAWTQITRMADLSDNPAARIERSVSNILAEIPFPQPPATD